MPADVHHAMTARWRPVIADGIYNAIHAFQQEFFLNQCVRRQHVDTRVKPAHDDNGREDAESAFFRSLLSCSLSIVSRRRLRPGLAQALDFRDA
ncbi:hypothetical protein, partial [Magnetospirillum moscoviense]|uniref:hypothetical protein n=1 Tax=Magnetospirillum moscoviense TaxID=1437059 RepID=UPI001C12CAD0